MHAPCKGKGTWDMSDFRCTAARAAAFGVGLAMVVGPAVADFDGHLVSGQFYYPDWDTPAGDPFEEIVTGAPEYVYSIPDHPFDGYYVNLDDERIEWRFSATDFPGTYWQQEVEVLGIIFTDVEGTMDGFQSLQLIESQTSYDVDWTSIEFGVLNEDQFFVNLGPVTGSDNIFGNADGFILEMSFVPAPASGFLLLGAFAGRRRRD